MEGGEQSAHGPTAEKAKAGREPEAPPSVLHPLGHLGNYEKLLELDKRCLLVDDGWGMIEHNLLFRSEMVSRQQPMLSFAHPLDGY